MTRGAIRCRLYPIHILSNPTPVWVIGLASPRSSPSPQADTQVVSTLRILFGLIVGSSYTRFCAGFESPESPFPFSIRAWTITLQQLDSHSITHSFFPLSSFFQLLLFLFIYNVSAFLKLLKLSRYCVVQVEWNVNYYWNVADAAHFTCLLHNLMKQTCNQYVYCGWSGISKFQM